jgi:hypothetical protein
MEAVGLVARVLVAVRLASGRASPPGAERFAGTLQSMLQPGSPVAHTDWVDIP